MTSGGDAPGMNAAIRSVVRTAISKGIKVMGVRKGYNGLINGDIFEMNTKSVSDTIQEGYHSSNGKMCSVYDGRRTKKSSRNV